MGYSTILDIIGSVIIGGLIMLILFRLSDAASKNTYNNSEEYSVQTYLTTIVGIIEYDFRKIGYNADYTKTLPPNSTFILSAGQNSISFLTDANSDSVYDTLSYYIGPTSELASTPNPNDRYLYRQASGKPPQPINVGLTEFRLSYFDAVGNQLTLPITNCGQISTIEINVEVEDPEAYNGEYVSAFWRQIRLAARNLSNR